MQFNAGHIDMTNSTDPWQVSEAMIKGRKVAAEYLRMLKDYQPQVYGNGFIVKTASLLGIRESRRIEGDYIFTIHDWLERRSFDDEIGRNCYFVVYTSPATRPSTTVAASRMDPLPYPHPQRQEKPAHGRALHLGRRRGSGSLRVMPPALVTGEAAGMAAALAAKQSRPDVHQVDVDFLRKRLREEGQYFK